MELNLLCGKTLERGAHIQHVQEQRVSVTVGQDSRFI